MASEASARIVAELWTRPQSRTLTLEQWRYAAGAAERQPWPERLRAEPVNANGVEAEWTWLGSKPAEQAPVAFVLHGGGFIVCSIGTHRRLAAELADAAGGQAFVVGYRLAPEAPFPAAVQDAVSAYRYLIEQDVDPSRVWFFGDSAGGNLCLAACLALRAEGVALPAAVVLASPLVDMTFSAASAMSKRDVDPFSRIDDPELMLQYYLGSSDPRDPLASPVFGDLAGLPPLLTLVGPDEMLLDDALLLHERATRAGVDSTLEIVDGAFHTWLGYAGSLPEADASIERIGAFVRSRLSVTSASNFDGSAP